MLQFKDFNQSVQRAQEKWRLPCRHAAVVATGLLVAILVSCGQSGRTSAPPIRELAPLAGGDEKGEGIVVAGSAEEEVDAALSDDAALAISAQSCRTTFDPELAQYDTEHQSPVRLVLDAVLVAQDDGRRCGQRSTEDIYCRALWLLEVLDPAVIAFDPSVLPAERLEAAASLDWALSAAVDAPAALADPGGATEGGDALDKGVGVAFAQLRPLSAELAQALEGVDATSELTADHEERLALLIRARVHPAILEPLSAMQTACLLDG